MTYRYAPAAARSFTHVDEWARWLDSTGLLLGLTPHDTPTCNRCRKPMRADAQGRTWPRCYQCNNDYAGLIGAVVPISYAETGGLTSVIRQAKEGPDAVNMRTALASVLCTFLHAHRRCLEVLAGGAFDLATVVPSHPSRRGGQDHMRELLNRVKGPWPGADAWLPDALAKVKPSIADDRRRQVDPDLFVVRPDLDLVGSRVLLVDDLFTTGSTTASAGRALVDAGAKPPVVVTLGRHVSQDDDTAAFLSGLRPRGLNLGSCAAHTLW